MKRQCIVVLLALVLPCLAFGQAQTPPPKPGPEVQQLAQWLGNWQCGYENKTGAQDKGEWDLNCAWSAGGFFLVCKGHVDKVSEFSMVWGYQPPEKAYWVFRYFSGGTMDFSKGWLSGNTWNLVFEDEHTRDGKARRRQAAQTFVSSTEWTYQFGGSVEGAPWVTTQVGKCTKAR